jgi:hypothetical protein
VLEFLATRVGLRIHPAAVVQRSTDFTVVRLQRYLEEAPLRTL